MVARVGVMARRGTLWVKSVGWRPKMLADSLSAMLRTERWQTLCSPETEGSRKVRQ